MADSVNALRVDMGGKSRLRDFLDSFEEPVNSSVLGKYFGHILKEEGIFSLFRELPVEIGVSFVTPSEMASYNRQYRGKEGATDVLSFAQWDFDFPEGWALPPGWKWVPLGDILICPEEVDCHAREEEHPFLKELLVVLTHGLLHLIGYEHGDEDSKKTMFALQEKYCDYFFGDHKDDKENRKEGVMRG